MTMIIYDTVVCMQIFFGICNHKTIQFRDEKFYFPRDIKTVFNEHKMSYKPPGYYYRTDSTSYELILGNVENRGDYDDQRQPKEALFSRAVHSYIFRLKASKNLFDSLQSVLESRYHASFKIVKGKKYIPEDLPEHYKKLFEPDLPFEAFLMKAGDCLMIGLKRSKSDIFGESVTVQFMYDLPLGKIGNQMDSF